MLHGIFVAATGLVLSASAHGWSGTAAWPDSAQRQAMQLQDVKSFTPELLTIKGNVTLLLHALATAQRLDHSTIRVDSPYSGKGSFRAFAWLQKRPAPVVFILSGLFADLSVFEGFTAEQLLFFHRQGYHVVVLPTVGGQSAMDDHSTVLPFSVVDVGKLELGLLNKILRRLGPERIRGVHVVGQSYGGFIAAVVAGLDASSARPVIDETTAISPIYDARKAILDLDSGIRRNSAPEYAGCRDFIGNSSAYVHLLGAEDEARLPPLLHYCTGWLVSVAGYQAVLKEHLRAAYRNRAFYEGMLNFNWAGDEGFLQSLEHVTFVDYATRILKSPAVSDGVPAEFLAPYWADMAARHAGRPKIRILTAADEIFGRQPQWARNPFHSFTESELIVLPWGGHVGYAFYLGWFEELLRAAFPFSGCGSVR